MLYRCESQQIEKDIADENYWREFYLFLDITVNVFKCIFYSFNVYSIFFPAGGNQGS